MKTMRHPFESLQHQLRTSLFLTCIVMMTVVSWFSASPLDARQNVVNGRLVQRLDGNGLEYKPEDATGASLKTDPELESILETAERYREDKNYRLATKLWQAVLQRSGDTLYSSDGKIYRSLVLQVEMLLAALPPEGLKVYRIDADANARQLLANLTPATEVSGLSQVVRLHFLSSEGDEAALRLAAVYMDRYDFIGARRLLKKIVDVYPDPTVPMDQVQLRLALCASFLGEQEQAAMHLQESKNLGRGFDENRKLVENSIGDLSIDSFETSEVDWTMAHGNVRRYGVMPSVPESYLTQEKSLVSKWQFYFEPLNHYFNLADTRGRSLAGNKLLTQGAQGTVGTDEGKHQTLWRKRGWRPAGQLLLDGQHVFFKTGADLTAWDISKIEERVARPDQTTDPVWRSLWRNNFQPDGATMMWRDIRRNYSDYGRRNGINFGNDPANDSEIQIFADQIYQRMSLIDGVVYSIEGERFDDRNKPEIKRRSVGFNAVFRRSRENFITAYEVESGRLLWQLPRTDSLDKNEKKNEGYLTGGGFMAAPIKFGEWLLLPLNEGGAISVIAIDPAQQGKTIWKSFLCDEPESSAPPQSPVSMTLEGSDLFVNCGVGVLFVLDPATGTVRFAKRYDRKGTVNRNMNRRRQSVRTEFDGWSEDMIIPYGRQMICFASDSREIHAYDRYTGETIWYMDRESHFGLKVDYLLGIYDKVLYAAGRQTVIAIDLEAEGSLLWGGDNLFGESTSYGRGMLTSEGLFLPVGNSIFQYGHKDENYEAKLIRKIPVDLGTNAPLGNLFSDGERIWVHGGSRLYGLWPDDRDSG